MSELKRHAPTIPVVDMGAVNEDNQIAAAIAKACREDGFFYLTGHGVPSETITAAFEAIEQFFERPLEEKNQYHIRHSHPHQRGYVPVFEENLGDGEETDHKESFDLGVDLAADHPDVLAAKPFSAPNVWPDTPAFQNAIGDYHQEMIEIGHRLVRLTAIGLNLDEDYFGDAMREPVANLRLLHYPASKKASENVGCGPHSDYGFMTVLAQDDVGGLEVEGENGTWIPVEPMPGAFVVNLGDLLTRWTGGFYRARRHRVADTGDQERYSIPFFLDPNVDAIIDVVPTCRDLIQGDAPSPISAGAYLQSRFDDTFGYRENPPPLLAKA